MPITPTPTAHTLYEACKCRVGCPIALHHQCIMTIKAYGTSVNTDNIKTKEPHDTSNLYK